MTRPVSQLTALGLGAVLGAAATAVAAGITAPGPLVFAGGALTGFFAAIAVGSALASRQ